MKLWPFSLTSSWTQEQCFTPCNKLSRVQLQLLLSLHRCFFHQMHQAITDINNKLLFTFRHFYTKLLV